MIMNDLRMLDSPNTCSPGNPNWTNLSTRHLSDSQPARWVASPPDGCVGNPPPPDLDSARCFIEKWPVVSSMFHIWVYCRVVWFRICVMTMILHFLDVRDHYDSGCGHHINCLIIMIGTGINHFTFLIRTRRGKQKISEDKHEPHVDVSLYKE